MAISSKQIFKNVKSVSEFMSLHKIVTSYLFIGNGPKLQYESLDDVKQKVIPLLDEFEEHHGKGKWLAVYGGDTYVEDKPDLGAVMSFVKQRYDMPLLAVQGWPEIEDFIDYVLVYGEEKDENGRIVYGGVCDDGKLLGGTKVYLGDEFRKLLTGVINLDAQGRIGKSEIKYAREIGINVIDVKPLAPKNQY